MTHYKSRWLLCGMLLSGCFAAQALWTNENTSATPQLIDELVAGLATCPELAESSRIVLKYEQGLLTHASAEAVLQETRICARYRGKLKPADHERLAYASLRQLLEQPSTQAARLRTTAPALGLKLSTQLLAH